MSPGDCMRRSGPFATLDDPQARGARAAPAAVRARLVRACAWLGFTAAAVGVALAGAARADGGSAMPGSVPPAYLQECGACHLAYPPGLLPARSWRRITTGLERHFGSDASLDAATLQLIDRWLQAHGGSGKRGTEEPPEDRITRAAWFVREHRKIDAAAWKLASVRSAAHCAACHGAADRGRFDEGSLRLPEGLDARQRRAWND